MMRSFLTELRRRNVLRVAAAYALVSWILIEAGSVLLPTFGAPEWFFRAWVLVVIFGFVLALIIAWVFEVTPEGVKREADIDQSSYQRASRGKMNAVIIALLVLALGVSVTFNVTGLRDRNTGDERSAFNSIAVLPFASRSIDEQDQYFADGIHDDILTRLADIDSLRVISRTSVNEYRGTTKNARQIGDELGVGTIVEGAIQRSGDQVRITVQLIDATTDEHLWASTYDKALTIQNVFDVQSEISAQIAASLETALTPEEQQRMAAKPTDNIDAYAEYVKGRGNLSNRTFRSLQEARAQFSRAIEVDPDYAQAHAGLAQTVLVTLANNKSISPGDAFSIAADAVDTALRIDPNLAEAYAVRGLLQMMQWEQTRTGDGNIDSANSYRTAIGLNRNLVDAYVWFASLRQAEGQFDAAIELLSNALTIDPLSRIPYVNLPSLYAALGQNAATTELLLKAISIFPEWYTPYNFLSTHLQKLGRLDESLAWGMRAMQLSDDPLSGANLVGIFQEFGDDSAVRDFVERFPDDHPLYPIGKSYWLYATRDYDAALTELEAIPSPSEYPFDIAFGLMVGASIMAGEFDKAYDYAARLSPALSSDADLTVDRKNVHSAVLLAFIEQKRNRARQAKTLLEKAQPVLAEIPRLGMAGHGIRDVQILVMLGRRNAAIEALAEAVDAGFVSSQAFDMWSFDEDPIIDPLRSDPRFRAIEQRMNNAIEEMRRNADLARSTGDWSALLAKAETV